MSEGIDVAFDSLKARVYDSYQIFVKPATCLNVIEFCNQILHVSLWPRQKFILKIFYNIPLDESEKPEIQWQKDNKGLVIPEDYLSIDFVEVIIRAGRRSSKSVLAAIIATYEIYKLLNMSNPQQYYGLITGTVIYVLHCAAEDKQAEHVQDYIKGYVRNSEWFQPYMDRVLEKEVRFFTKFDKDNDADKGSIRVVSLTSNSSSMPGSTAKVVILDEIARMMDTKGRLSGDKIYQALTPSVKTFKTDGKIIDISSPLTKAGKLYDLEVKSQKIKSMICFSYATWELNPTLTKNDFRDEYDKNPEWATMEYGAEYGEVLDRAFDWDKIDKIIVKGRSLLMMPIQDTNFVICCDGATRNDRYGIAWGHAETIESQKFIVIDGLKYYEAQHYKDEQGDKKVVEIDLDEVDDFVINLIHRLGHVSCIAYDQGKSTASIQKLKKKNYNAIETTFTAKYKSTLYMDTNTVLNQERLKAYEMDSQNAIGLLINEMKYLERTVKGDIIHVGHPLMGPVVTDDLYDAVSNLIHILISDNPKQVVQVIHEGPRIIRTQHNRWG